MSVVINGIKMPRGEDDGVLIALYDGQAYHIGTKEKHEAIELPPHGRLVDADALIAKITDAAIKQPEIADVYYEQASEIGGWLYSMPTIIPADKEET